MLHFHSLHRENQNFLKYHQLQAQFLQLTYKSSHHNYSLSQNLQTYIQQYKQNEPNNLKMSTKFDQAMQHRFNQDLITASQDKHEEAQDDDSYDSQNSQDYYEYERKKIQSALDQLKAKKNNQVLQQLKKNIEQEIEELQEYEDEIVELHNITRNNQKNVLQQSVIKDIKQKVFNQSMMHTIQLADQELEKKRVKQQIIEYEKAASNGFQIQRDKKVQQAQIKLNQRMEAARMQREIMQMNRQDELSMKYQQQILSNFFSERFYNPDMRIPENKPIQVNIVNYAPKATFTNLKPLANTENNVLPRNAPELALRRLGRSKKITFVSSSMSQVPVKIKKLNPEIEDILTENLTQKKKTQNQQIQQHIQNYLSTIKPLIPKLQTSSQNYHPKFIPQFRSQTQQNPNLNLPSSINPTQKQKTLQSLMETQNNLQLKQLKLTFQQISSLTGIENYPNIEHASLQFNAISMIDGIQRCQKLVQVNLRKNKIKSVDCLRDLKWLRMLNIQYNFVDKLDLRGGSLQVLYAGHNRIQEIVQLSDNIYMRRLSIGNNNLHQFSGLSKLHFLQQIYASHNFITNLDNLQNCLSLRILDVTHNRVTQLHPNFTYIFLNKLLLSNNFIQQFPNLFLPSLEELYVNNNRIEKQIKSLLYLPSLKVLNVDQNRLSGFGVVWGMLRYSCNLRSVRYEQNQYFRDIRDKVRQLYQHIIYKNMSKLEILNHSPYDFGVKKYYESIFSSYLSQKMIFKDQSTVLKQVHKKILFTIKQNQAIAYMEDKRIKFSESDIFVRQKSVNKVEDLVQILEVLGVRKGENCKIMHASRSLFYQHDRFQFKMRSSLHKIGSLIIKKWYRRQKRLKYFKTKKPQLTHLIRYLEKHLILQKLKKILKIFHLPLQRMSLQKAAIIIQKNWRCYRLRKKYKRIMKKLKQQKMDDWELEQIDLDEYDFDKMEVPQFNFQIPEDIDFDQFVIRPEIFDMLNQQQEKRDKKYQSNNSVMNGNRSGPGNNHGGNGGSDRMINNFIENNQSNVSEHHKTKNQIREQKIQTLMTRWGVNRQAAQALHAKNQMKERRKQKQAQKNMTATQRYEKFKRDHRH